VDALYSLQDQWAVPVVPNELEVFPVTIHSRITFLQPLRAKEDIFLGLLVTGKVSSVYFRRVIWELGMLFHDRLAVIASHEDGVGFPNLDTHSVAERDIRRLKVVGPPPNCHRVKCYDQGFKPVLLGPSKKRQCNIVRARPGSRVSVNYRFKLEKQ
jgi:hypothetical protein